MSEAGDGVELERRSLADAHLAQAVEALRASGSPEALFNVTARTSANAIVQAAARAQGTGKRVGFARTAILFAALASEGFANEFLSEHLVPADVKAVDRLPTVEKYVLGPKIALGESLFDRGHEPLQSIQELFRLRDKLVHTRPRNLPKRSSVFDDPADFDEYNPSRAAQYIVAVADAAMTLASKSSEPLMNLTVVAVANGRKLVVDYGHKATDRLPPVSGPVEEDLVMQAIQAITGRSRDYRTPVDAAD
jgi:hypothetical protein